MEENKLIAEFMGFPKQQDAVDDRTIAYYVGESILWTDNTDNENEYDVFHPDDMQFHTSWNWLMPVVDKIESLGYSYDRINADVFINNQNGENVIPNPMDGNTMTMIEKTYYVVVEFINEYNRTDGK
tara:strand:+ start:1848 stop:2228 length:381 start_codon:yes stop_codon:yes gene_type:complete